MGTKNEKWGKWGQTDMSHTHLRHLGYVRLSRFPLGVQTPGVGLSIGESYYTNPITIGNLNSFLGSSLFPQQAALMAGYQALCGS
jgi:hypothetical protein